jgi:hypothetical protein
MTSELQYFIRFYGNPEVCSEQESLTELLTDLRTAANNLDLDLDRAYLQAKTQFESRDPSPFCPCI